MADEAYMSSDNDQDEGRETGGTFKLTNGEQIHLDYGTVYIYQSKGNSTLVQYGWADSRQTFTLDIDFSSFDAIITEYKKNNYYCY